MKRGLFCFFLCAGTVLCAQGTDTLQCGPSSDPTRMSKPERWYAAILEVGEFTNKTYGSIGFRTQVYLGKRLSLNLHYAIGGAVTSPTDTSLSFYLHSPIFFALVCRNFDDIAQQSQAGYYGAVAAVIVAAFIPEGISYDVWRRKRACFSLYANPFGCDYFEKLDHDRFNMSIDTGPAFTIFVGRSFFLKFSIGSKFMINRGELGMTGSLMLGGISR